MRKNLFALLFVGLIGFGGITIAQPNGPTAPDAIQISAKEATRIATDAYVYGYPAVLMEMTKRVMTNVPSPIGERAPLNQFAHARSFPTPASKDVVSPNLDTLYSVAWLDLSKEPVVLRVPDSQGRYFLLPLLDAWSNVFASPGSRTTGGGRADYAIVGPDWKGRLPKGVTAIRAPTNLVWIIGRTYCDGSPSDLAAVHTFQDQLKLTPLSYYGQLYTPAKEEVSPEVDMKTPPQEQTFALDGVTFFKTLAEIMKTNPPAPADAPFLRRLARIGLAPGKDFDTDRLSPAVVQALDRAAKVAQQKIQTKGQSTFARPVNGWSYDLRIGSYGTNYLLRAFVARIGLGANLPQDAVYSFATKDGSKKQLEGSKRYVLHFDKGKIPPVNSFWSLTLYDQDHHLVSNSIDRSALKSADQLKYNRDGSLDLFIQPNPPADSLQSNWLPSPPGDFNLILRLYWPKPEVLNGQWRPAPVRQNTTRTLLTRR